ncbi:hypothetical protein BAUR9175_00327 [Brevibacterium aurantiacum]|uniref:Uncharacterized protein n=1 Tax=Brevibacterium aurantiacum TaxID=273384 RepID=A0A2H1HQZ2_BREAU|nr:hypothetical protein BAUR9175_00327 [Brevibacterium aurantiacum]
MNTQRTATGERNESSVRAARSRPGEENGSAKWADPLITTQANLSGRNPWHGGRKFPPTVPGGRPRCRHCGGAVRLARAGHGGAESAPPCHPQVRTVQGQRGRKISGAVHRPPARARSCKICGTVGLGTGVENFHPRGLEPTVVPPWHHRQERGQVDGGGKLPQPCCRRRRQRADGGAQFSPP